MNFFKNMSAKDKILFALNPQFYAIGKGTEIAIEKIQNMANKEDSTIEMLREEATRQEIIAQVSEAQAKVTQELAIAQRINTAETVEIEEFYDTSGKGGINANVNEAGLTGGLSGEGRKVTKRIYKFSGWHSGATEVFEKMNNEDN